MASFGQRFEHVLFLLLILVWLFKLVRQEFFYPLIMLPAKCKSEHEWAGQAAKRGLAAVEDMFAQESKQFKAELEAEGLSIDSSPLEAAMALAAWEEVRPLHKLSSVRIPAILLAF